MRLFFLGPRIFGVMPGVSFQPRLRLRSLAARPPSFVYVIAQCRELVKVGIAADPMARLATLQTGNSEPLRLVYIAAVKSNDALTIERETHRILEKYRFGALGEWFNVSPEMAVAAIGAASFRTNDPIMNVPLDRVREIVAQATTEGARLPIWLSVIRWGALIIPVLFGLALALIATVIYAGP